MVAQLSATTYYFNGAMAKTTSIMHLVAHLSWLSLVNICIYQSFSRGAVAVYGSHFHSPAEVWAF